MPVVPFAVALGGLIGDGVEIAGARNTEDGRRPVRLGGEGCGWVPCGDRRGDDGDRGEGGELAEQQLCPDGFAGGA